MNMADKNQTPGIVKKLLTFPSICANMSVPLFPERSIGRDKREKTESATNHPRTSNHRFARVTPAIYAGNVRNARN
jgi:hypothetical protein